MVALGWVRSTEWWCRIVRLSSLVQAAAGTSPWLASGILLCIAAGLACSMSSTVAAAHLLAVVVAAAGKGWVAGGSSVVRAITLVAALVLARSLVGLVQQPMAGSLVRRVDIGVQQRLMQLASGPAAVGHLEDPNLLDELRNASSIGGFYTTGIGVAGWMSNLEIRLGALGQAVLVGVYFRWWVGVLLAVSSMAMRSLSMGWFLSTLKVATGQAETLRRAEYDAKLGFTPPAAKEIRVFGLSGWLVERFHDDWLSALEPVWRERRSADRIGLALWSWPGQAVTVGVLALAAHAILAGRVGLASLSVLLQGIFAAGMVFMSTSDHWVQYGAETVAARRRLTAALSSNNESLVGADVGEHPIEAIRFEGVTFRYPGQDRDVFTNLDLTIPCGRSVAIVGVNGAGKTTLIKLLTRMYEPIDGRITADGTDIRDFDAAAWQRRVAAIFQDFVHYDVSAAENIGFGAPEHLAERDRIVDAARRAGIADVIEALPSSWNTTLSREYENGAELSGGQWQRVALARALFATASGARVLVLDEPTASLDVRTEAELFDRFLDLAAGLTTILISHRFSTVRHAEQICVIDKGRVVEHGTHADLLAMGGRYAHMFGLQAKRFTDQETTVA